MFTNTEYAGLSRTRGGSYYNPGIHPGVGRSRDSIPSGSIPEKSRSRFRWFTYKPFRAFLPNWISKLNRFSPLTPQSHRGVAYENHTRLSWMNLRYMQFLMRTV